MEKQLTQLWMTYQRNGWVIRKEHMHGCRVTRVYARRPGSNCELLLGQYEETLGCEAKEALRI